MGSPMIRVILTALVPPLSDEGSGGVTQDSGIIIPPGVPPLCYLLCRADAQRSDEGSGGVTQDSGIIDPPGVPSNTRYLSQSCLKWRTTLMNWVNNLPWYEKNSL